MVRRLETKHMEFTRCEEAFRGGPREEVEPGPTFVSDSSGGAVESLVSVHPHTQAHCAHMSTVPLGHSLPQTWVSVLSLPFQKSICSAPTSPATTSQRAGMSVGHGLRPLSMASGFLQGGPRSV